MSLANEFNVGIPEIHCRTVRDSNELAFEFREAGMTAFFAVPDENFYGLVYRGQVLGPWRDRDKAYAELARIQQEIDQVRV